MGAANMVQDGNEKWERTVDDGLLKSKMMIGVIFRAFAAS